MGENQDAKLVPLANVENIYGIIAMSFKKKPCSTYHVILVWQLMFEMHAKEQSCCSIWSMSTLSFRSGFRRDLFFPSFGGAKEQQFVLETLPAGRGSNMCWEIENKINSSRDHIFARAS